ncbi:MAG: hypothetical protein ACR2HG_14750 [Pyrinomonadaceae bacterium]
MVLLQIELNYYDIALIGIAVGFLFGLIPLILGLIKKERSYAVYGFFGSLIGGAILGVFLAIPVAAVFTWLIFRKPKSETVPDSAHSFASDVPDSEISDSDAS